MAMRQLAAVVLSSVGFGVAVWGWSPRWGLTAGGALLFLFTTVLLIDFDEEPK